MRTKKKGKLLSDAGIRLKPDEPNLLENYSKHLRKFKKVSKRKKKGSKKGSKKKKSVKQVKIRSKMDPMEKIADEVVNNSNKKELVIKTITVAKKAKELSETDPNVKSLTITASLKPDKKKKGGGIII
jgi:hypothetical protein|tara:strand:- start:2020 stop:2403 length:384 start_codon:yes stop_codon:yes gene_type:complete